MLLEEVRRPFDDKKWLYEIKFDGYRLLAGFGSGDVQLRSRNGNSMNARFPEIVQTLRAVVDKGMVVDGEVAILDDQGRSDFDRLHARALLKRYDPAAPVVYCVFDALMAAGRDITALSLPTRKKRLAKLQGLPGILLVDHFVGEGTFLYEQALRLELEGIVAKRAAAPYQSGMRSGDWLKIKRPGAVPPQRFSRKKQDLAE